MIKLSKMTDYAVVILASMAQERGKRLSAAVLAEKTGLPEPTVAKILKILAKEGIITSERGVNGGYALNKAESEIAITGVIQAMDGPLAIASCVDGHDGCCAHESTCSIKGRWSPINAAIQKALDGVTLADMVGDPR